MQMQMHVLRQSPIQALWYPVSAHLLQPPQSDGGSMSSAASARNTPQVSQATSDTQYNVPNAALRGASSAFSKPNVKPKPLVNNYTGGSNGALLAATKVGTPTPRTATSPRVASPSRRDWAGGGLIGRPTHFLSTSSSSSNFDVPVDYLSDHAPSPSNIAAKLAAARYSPMNTTLQATAMSMSREKDPSGADVNPSAAGMSNVLARLNSPQQPPSMKGSPRSQSRASTVQATVEDTKATDDTPILPTTSLVKMFEHNRPTTPVKGAPKPITLSQGTPPIVQSPKPRRKINIPPEPNDGHVRKSSTGAPPVKPKPKLRSGSIPSAHGQIEEPARNTPFSGPKQDTFRTPGMQQKSPQLSAIKTAVVRPTPPLKRISRSNSQDIGHSTSYGRRLSTSSGSNENEALSSPSSYASAPEQPEEEKSKPIVPPPRRSNKPRPEGLSSRVQPDLHPKPSPQATNIRSRGEVPSPLDPPEKFTRRPSNLLQPSPPVSTVYHSNYQRESVKAITQHMTGESLSNAIMGAALASSRNASPAPSSTATPPFPIHTQRHHSPFRQHRSPSPPKPGGKMKGKLRTTLRKEPSSSSDEDESERYKRKGTRVMGVGRKHPNKHHEGSRKRWRDVITDRERKRYEGVWAANKGLHMAQPSRFPSYDPQMDADPMLDVLNLVTKEIWQRSRLPEHVLEEVWALVDGRGVGRLQKEEFVVGLWLIDQRLKGRKLPPRVSDSVWGSVRGTGVKVKVKHK